MADSSTSPADKISTLSPSCGRAGVTFFSLRFAIMIYPIFHSLPVGAGHVRPAAYRAQSVCGKVAGGACPAPTRAVIVGADSISARGSMQDFPVEGPLACGASRTPPPTRAAIVGVFSRRARISSHPDRPDTPRRARRCAPCGPGGYRPEAGQTRRRCARRRWAIL